MYHTIPLPGYKSAVHKKRAPQFFKRWITQLDSLIFIHWVAIDPTDIQLLINRDQFVNEVIDNKLFGAK